jgi:hypothetical protein
MGCTHSTPTPRSNSPTTSSSPNVAQNSSSVIKPSPTMHIEPYARPPTPHPHSNSNLSTSSRGLVLLSTAKANSKSKFEATVEASNDTNTGSGAVEGLESDASRRRSQTELVDVNSGANTEGGSPYVPIGPRLTSPRPLLPREKSIQWYDGYVSGESVGNGEDAGSVDDKGEMKGVDGGANNDSAFAGGQ